MQMQEGALATLECEPRWRLLHSAQLRCSQAQPLAVMLAARPLPGVKLKAHVDPRKEARSLRCLFWVSIHWMLCRAQTL